MSARGNGAGGGGGVEHGETVADVGLAPSGIMAVTQMYVTFTLGSALFSRGQGRLAGKAVRRAFLILEDVVRDSHFGLDWMLLDLLYDFVTRGQHALYTTLVAHLANVAAALLAPHHPISLIADQLRRYGAEGRDVATLLQRAFYSKIDAVQSDADARAALAAQNRRVGQLLLPGGAGAAKMMDPEMRLVIQGIQATHYELEMQKGSVRGNTKTKKKKKHPEQHPQYQQHRKPQNPPSPPFSSSPSSSSSSSSSRSPPTTSPRLPSPTPSFTNDPSHPPDPTKTETTLLPTFIESRTRRSLHRMPATNPDALTLRVADRLFFSEYTPELGTIYKLKGRAWDLQRRGLWAEAVVAQRDLLAAMREKTALDVWGIIRELWALERLLLLLRVRDGDRDREGDGAIAAELEDIAVEVDFRARGLLDDIPDDAP